MQLILASTSPRRRELLALLNIPFEVRSPSFDEQLRSNQSAIEQIKRFAAGKAWSIAVHEPEAIVLGSDTVIELDHLVLGKPADEVEARRMLQRLAGRNHQVHTAIALLSVKRKIEIMALSTAIVRMKAYDEQAHERYLATGEGLGKAGAYSIQGQGGDLIASIEGDFPTVVGLPLRLVATLLAQAGLTVSVEIEALYTSKPYPNWIRFSSTPPS
jgi:septum formation protein